MPATFCRSRSRGGGGVKTLLLTLLVGLAALAGLTLSAAAQPGGDGAADADPQGRIIARIQDRTGDDGVDDYRIEFGFFPEWAMDDKDPWSEAVATWSDWLPRLRYLNKTVIDRRAAADNRRWLRSSLISVPTSAQRSGGGAQLEDDGASGQSLIEGRVIARYHPDSRGRLRVEFGFLPEWAFIRTADTEEAVEQYGGDLLPRSRYISASMIESRRGVWLRSSAVEVPLRAPVVVIEQPQAPAIDSISCSPSSPTVDQNVTCTAALSGGDPDTYAWSGGASGGDTSTYNTSFSSSGGKTVSLTVTNSAGSDTETITLTVEQPLQAPAIDSIRCSPSQPVVDENVTCAATLSGGEPDTYAWQTANGSGAVAEHSTSFGKAGEYAISLTVANAAGDDSESITLTVSDELQAPVIDSVSCPSSAAVNESITCTASNSGGAIESYAWTDSDGGSGSGASYSTSFSSTGAKTVSLTARNAAGSDSDSTGVTVTGAPQINISCPSTADVGESVACTVSNSGGAIDSYNWRDSDGGSGSGSSYSTSFSTSGAKTIRVTARNSAGSDSDSASVRVAGAPVISVSCPSSAAVDQSVACTVSNSSGAIDSYSWSDSDGGSGSGSSYSTSFSSAGAKTIRLTARNSAGSDSDSTTVTVEEEIEPPEINISCPSSAAVYQPNVACTVSNSGGAIESYAWSDSDGGSGSSSSYSTSFTTAGAKTISLTARNSAGSDNASATVEVREPPLISVSCPSSAAVNESITCTVSNSGGPIDTYAWSDNGGGSGSGSSYSTSFSTAGTKTILLYVRSSAGSDEGEAGVEVRAAPPPVQLPDVSISCPSSAAVDQSVACTASNSGGAIDSYAWSDSGGGSGSSSTYSTRFHTSGAKTVSLTASNRAGSDSDSTTVEVRAPLSPPVIDSISCSSSRPDVDEIITCTVSASGGAIDSYTWSGGSGSNSHGGRRGATYRVSFVFDATERIRLIVRNAAGSDRETIWIEVQPVRPYIVISCPSSAGVDESVTCTLRNSGAAIDSYSWSDSDGGSGSSASYSTSFSSLGAKTVSATASNSVGSHNARATINVLPELPQISISCPSSVVLNESVDCTVSNSGGAIDRYVWSDSDGGAGSSSSYSTSFRYTGQRTVLLYAHNAAGHDSDSVIVEVRAPPQPEVQQPDVSISCPSSAAVYQPNVACTVSNSGGAIDSYAWSDSDGGSGSSSSYSTSFTTAGAKTISLTARNSAGSDNASATVEVREPPQISVSCPSSAVVNESITCTVSNSGGPIDTYAWSDNGGGSGSGSSYSTSFSTTGAKTVLLYVRSSAGSDNGEAGVEVRAAAPPVQLPDVSISCPSSAAVNQRVACTVSNSGGAIDSYAWSDSGGGSGSGSSYSTRFHTSGAKTVSLTATNSAGSDSASAGVNVIALPVITVSCPSTADTGETITCTVSNSGGAIVRYIWVASDGGSGSGSSYSTSFSSAGAKGIRLTARNAAGAASDSTTVEVRAASP